jgi:hypothetical protein
LINSDGKAVVPRYFFHTVDGSRDRDTVGTEFPDHAAARKAGIRVAGELLNEDPDRLWDGQEFRVEVTNRDNTLLFTIILRAVNAVASDAS